MNSSTDGDSVQTEDFEIEYQKSLVKQAVQYAGKSDEQSTAFLV